MKVTTTMAMMNTSKKADFGTTKIKKTMSQSTVVVATSPMAMGKALVLLATSCAALSSQPMAMISTRRGSPSHHQPMHHRGGSHRRSGGRVHHPSRNGNDAIKPVVALHYRDGDADQPLDMQAANKRAVHQAASNSAPAAATPTSDPRHNMSTTRKFTLFAMPSIVKLMPSTSVHQSSKEEDEQQLVMDEYIEFYERRYSRLHATQPHQKKKGSSSSRRSRPISILDFHLPRKIFLSTLALHRSSSSSSTTKSITQPNISSEGPSTSRQHQHVVQDEVEDHLNALGLSNLASARLRQRLHVPRDLRDEHMLFYYMTHGGTQRSAAAAAASVITSAVAGGAASSSSAVASTAAAATGGGRTSSYISLSFPAQVQLLLRTMQRLTLAFVNTMKILTAFASRMFTEILDKGGFRHSVRMMSVASLAVLLMFRPLFRGALKQG